ncbi:hypothetical protein EDD29_0019 [Actinocorallia herbida]|uniref:Uncharacterized protein n=1 Tax=Actinocorallia herbida TaxID=58109 RepID=A0A3N1CMK3_9ACTN|nr:hypothetical protein [Actinocorallia herbida]ROO82539.1 hypothetical protein EDD29_0019 [Actinocorallia herbida]
MNAHTLRVLLSTLVAVSPCGCTTTALLTDHHNYAGRVRRGSGPAHACPRQENR